jgi:hypothetical protein
MKKKTDKFWGTVAEEAIHYTDPNDLFYDMIGDRDEIEPGLEITIYEYQKIETPHSGYEMAPTGKVITVDAYKWCKEHEPLWVN